MSELSQKTCIPCEAGVKPLSQQEAEAMLDELNGWTLNKEANQITQTFQFKGFYKTIAFVNAVAWIANQEGHHPDLEVSYNRCTVHYQTHTINGLSKNDFICAAKIDALISEV